MVKKVYYGNHGLSLAWDSGIIFLAYQIVRFVRIERGRKQVCV